ncbi:MAG: hypothetical protein JW953_04865 [Anaerolineae bacterium]|nr:hypothetical protein [Anaerolineae bacterium]
MNKNQTFIILMLVALLLCICVALFGAGGYYYYYLLNNQSVANIAPEIPPMPTQVPPTQATPAEPVDAPAPDFESSLIFDEPGSAFEQLKLSADPNEELHLLLKQEIYEGSSTTAEKVLYAQRPPDGVWAAPQRLSTAQPDKFDPDLTALMRRPDGQLCLVLHGFINDNRATYLRCLAETTWSDPELVTEENAQVVFAPDGSRHIAGDRNGFLLYFDNTPLTPDEFDNVVEEIAVAVDPSGRYHLVWQQMGGPLSYHSSNDGQTWSNPEVLTDEHTRPWFTPQLMLGQEGSLHLAWTGHNGVFYRRWLPDQGWQPPVEISPVVHGEAILTVGPDGLAHVIWSQENKLMYTQQQADNTWSEPRPMADVDASAGILQRGKTTLAVDAQGQRHFVWVSPDNKLYYGVITQ